MNRMVLLDSNSLINRAFYALPALMDSKGRYTNAIYGFVSMIVRIIKELNPTHMAAAFDLKGPTFRTAMYSDYKATRKPMPDELGSQIPMLKSLLTAMGIAIAEYEGYEADDVIGTLSKHTPFDTVIVSGDRDTLQLIDDTTRVWYTRKGISNVEELDLISLKAKGYTPEMIIELKALMGDSSDNIPGVSGVGEKTATALLNEYCTLDNLYLNLSDIKGKLREKLCDGRDIAYLSRDLATINKDVPIDINPDSYKFRYPFNVRVREMLSEYDIRSLINRFEYDESVEKVVTEGAIIKVDDYKTIKSLTEKLLKAKVMALYIDKDIHIALDKKTEYVIPVSGDLLNSLVYDNVLNELNAALIDPKVLKVVYDYKSLLNKLNGRIDGLSQDLMIKSYVTNAGMTTSSLMELINSYGMSGELIAVEMLKINEDLGRKLKETSTEDLYYNIEMPLISVLYDMEKTGFCVDSNILEEQKEKLSLELDALCKEIYKYSKGNFNINSSRQLSEVLFQELKLPSLKKNKTGYSLSADVLLKMRKLHPIIDLILKYRHISKLLSTYIEGLRTQIESDGRVHTIFKQASTATGRLSSIEPNLQNLPIRDEIGREIRKMFVSSPDNILVTADYSQIELRLLAHFSSDEKLINSYISGEDIHTRTAAEIFSVSMDEVTQEMRRKAKAVNFGIIYGISSFGLSENIDIPVKAAKEYIDRYFETYPAVRAYMDKNIEIAKATGRIKTITGRLRSIPELMSDNYNLRSFGERAAMNMPLQGSAADIIKIAMINVYKQLSKRQLKSKLILQIHDELVVDTRQDELTEVKGILLEEMESAVALRVPLTVDISCGRSLYEAK